MSSIKSTQFDGDVSIGRNLSLGGLFTVQGPSIMKGNVRIDGWLDAKNIKGANKGIFTTAEKLIKAYPRPHDGWWAIVGTSLPGPIYVGEGGEWVATGETGGNPTLDGDLYVKAIEDLRQDLEEHITLYDSHFDKEGNLTAEKIIANGPLVCVSDFDSNSVTTTAGLESFRIGSSTNPNYGWGTYIWSYDNGHGFIQQGSQTGETFTLKLQPFGGNVGINWGNNSSAQYTLDVNGAIRSTREIIAKRIDINEVFEADTLSATINSIDVFEVNSGTVLLNSNVDITGNATIGGTLDVTGGVTADGLTIGEVLISYDNRILGPELNANVLIVNGKTVFTDEIEVSEHVTIDRQGYITGVMYTGEVDCTGYTQQEGVFVVQSSEPMELDTNVNIYQGLNVANNATVGGKLSVTGFIQSYETVSAAKGLIAYGGGLQIYSGGIDCKGGNATIGGTLDVTGGVTADGLTIGEVLISYDNRILGPELNANVLIVNGKTVFTDEIEVSEHVTIDRQGYITGVMYTGEVDCTGYTQQEGVFVVQSSEPMELDTNVNIYQGLNVDSSIAVTGETLLQDLSVTGSAIFNSGFWSIGQSSFEYPIYMNCEMSESYPGIYMQELQEYEHIRVIGFSEDAAGNEYIDIGEEQYADSQKYYRGIRLNGAINTVKGSLRVEESFTSPGSFNLGDVMYYSTGDDRVDFSTDILLQIVDGLNGREMEHGAIKSYSFGCFDYIRLLGLTKNAFSTDSIPSLEIGSAEDYAQDGYSGIRLFGDTHVDGNIHLGYHSNTALGVHTSLTTEFADTGMKVHLIGLQDTTNGKCLLSIGSKSYVSATTPDAIVLVTSYESGSIELIGNVYVPQTFKLGGATFTYDAINDRVVCDKRIVNAGAEK